jgi:hypothetical protein
MDGSVRDRDTGEPAAMMRRSPHGAGHAAGPRPFRRLEWLAGSRWGLLLLAAWGCAESIAFPVIPDLALGLLVLVAPRRALALFAATIIGGLAGTAILYGLTLADPAAVRTMLLALPAIRPSMLVEATALVAGGDPFALVLFGAGAPLKVYAWAWAAGAGTPAGLGFGVILNRLSRIGPLVLVAAVIGTVGAAFIRRHDRLTLAVYAAFWAAVYASYWGG